MIFPFLEVYKKKNILFKESSPIAEQRVFQYL